mgnify:CR=1 FL=1
MDRMASHSCRFRFSYVACVASHKRVVTKNQLQTKSYFEKVRSNYFSRAPQYEKADAILKWLDRRIEVQRDMDESIDPMKQADRDNDAEKFAEKQKEEDELDKAKEFGADEN